MNDIKDFEKGEFKKVKCHCPCHSFKGVKHVRPCCNGGYIEIFIPYSQLNKDSLTPKK